MEQRNRGIDLLRMAAMWMVVILHILNKGGVLEAAAPMSAGRETARLLEIAAYCAVNCYGLISGYVGVGHRFRYSGAIALWLRAAFYTLGITAAFALLMPGSVNGDRVLRAFLPEAEIVVDAACCAGVTPEAHRTALEAMKACQVVIENEV